MTRRPGNNIFFLCVRGTRTVYRRRYGSPGLHRHIYPEVPDIPERDVRRSQSGLASGTGKKEEISHTLQSIGCDVFISFFSNALKLSRAKERRNKSALLPWDAEIPFFESKPAEQASKRKPARSEQVISDGKYAAKNSWSEVGTNPKVCVSLARE